MAYDDDERGNSWEDLVTLLAQFGTDLTVSQAIALTDKLATVGGGRSSENLSIREVRQMLVHDRLSGISVEIVAGMADVVAPHAKRGNALEKVTLAQMAGVIGKRR